MIAYVTADPAARDKRSIGQTLSKEHCVITYAQNFEDVMLWRVFRDKPEGFYVDVGAADPSFLSVTKWFYDLGWRGINIEPHPDLYEQLIAHRPRDTNLNCGAGAVRGTMAFFELPTREWSSFDPAIRDEAMARNEAVTERDIPVAPLNEILDRHRDGRAINFLKIDVEGWEEEVLKGLDLHRHRPTVLVMEATRQGAATLSDGPWRELVAAFGYREVYFDGVNKFYVPGEHMELAQHFTRPPNVFDEFVPAEVVRLHALLRESEADRNARLEQVEVLTKLLRESEADRAARFEQIETLTGHLKKAEADRVAELQHYHSYQAPRIEQIRTLSVNLAKSERESAGNWAGFWQSRERRADRAETITKISEVAQELAIANNPRGEAPESS